MGSRILSVVDTGMAGRLTEIECHISNGLPSIVIVGSASRAVDEAKERLRGAFTNSHLLIPKRRITIIGGGQKPRPGEISLSHGGVLFLDELPEFHRDTIEALRQPLEDRVISVARASGNIVYPANFILVATANPCPCGYLGSSRACECMPHQITRYQRKLSGPIMDRIDLYVDVQEVEHDKLLHKQQSAKTSHEFRSRVENARELQTARFKKPMTNALMTNRQIKQHARLLPEAEQLLNKAATSLQLSPRVYMRTIKVGRTIADLDGATDISSGHIAEALQYRQRQQEFL